MAINLADLFEHAVDLVGDRVALIQGERQVSYAELEADANRLAHHLAGHGVGVGAHVGLQCANSIEAATAMLAAYKLRAVPVNVNYRYQAEELRYLYTDADLVALVHDRRHGAAVGEALRGLSGPRHVVVIDDGTTEAHRQGTDYRAALAGQSALRDFGPRSGADHYLLYTGGTTGMPKGVLWRHADVWPGLGGGLDPLTGEPMDEWAPARAGRERELVRLCLPPLIHASGQWVTLNGLFGCATVIYLPKFDPVAAWRAVRRHRVNTVSVVGDAMARPLIEEFEAGGHDAGSLTSVLSHAARLSAPVRERLLAALPHVVLTDSIGSTESGFNGVEVISAAAGAGSGDGARVRPGPGVIALDDQDRPIPPRSGRVGRLARAGHIPLGYHRDAERTARLFVAVDGVRHVVPGDYVRMERDGTMTLLGRGNTSINTGGEKVFGEEVEGVLKSHPEVFDALVLGMPDERLGQRVVALVALRPGAAPEPTALTEHVRGRLAGYKVPRAFWLVEQVERTPSGKPDFRWARRHLNENPVPAQP